MNDTLAQVRDWVTQPYTVADAERDMAALRPRFIDTWVIPPLMIWLGLSQKALHRWPRRMLFTAGAYLLMRNYANYKSAVASLAAMTQSKKEGSS